MSKNKPISQLGASFEVIVLVNTISSDPGVKVKTADADCSPLDRLNVWGGGNGPAAAAPHKPSRAQLPTQWPTDRRISFPSSFPATRASGLPSPPFPAREAHISPPIDTSVVAVGGEFRIKSNVPRKRPDQPQE